jgi:hypothetical protein
VSKVRPGAFPARRVFQIEKILKKIPARTRRSSGLRFRLHWAFPTPDEKKCCLGFPDLLSFGCLSDLTLMRFFSTLP